MKTIITNSPEETFLVAKDILKSSRSRVIALFGDLGSGKTTFTQGIAKELGIKRNVPSPTFLVLRQYDVSYKDIERLVHIDLYRLESSSNIAELGIEEGFEDPKTLTVIEWAEKMQDKLPPRRAEIHFEYVDETKRKIIVKEI